MLWKLVGIAALCYAALLVFLWLMQTKLVFPGGRVVDRTPDFYGWPYEEAPLPVDGETTHAWFIPGEDPRGVVLFSHGNAGTMADRLESVEVFQSLGFSVLIYDYGGYGHSSGRPSEQRCYADIRAMWAYMTEQRHVAPEHIVLFGRSLGGGPTVNLAANLETAPAAVILESTFVSAAQLGQELFPFAPVKYVIRHRFDNGAKIERVRAPLLIIHSPDDDVVPFRHGRRLFELANDPKHFFELRGTHNEGWVLCLDSYQRALADFLLPLFPGPPP